MKRNAIVRIVIWSIVLLMLVGMLLTGFGFRTYRNRWNVAEETMVPVRVTEPVYDETGIGGQSFELPAQDISKLAIEWVSGDITILAKEGIDQIIVQEEAVSNSRYIMQWRQSGSTLKIKFFEEAQMRIGTTVDISKDLVIEVPAGWVCQELELDVAATDLDVRNLTIRNVDFDGASGTCNFVNCAVEDLDIDTASGDVVFNGTLETLDFDAASASFIGEFQSTPRRIDMDGMSGDLDIALPEDTGFTVSADGMSCSVRSDFYGTELRSENQVYGDGRCKINVSGMSCDVTIRKLDTIVSGTIPGEN